MIWILRFRQQSTRGGRSGCKRQICGRGDHAALRYVAGFSIFVMGMLGMHGKLLQFKPIRGTLTGMILDGLALGTADERGPCDWSAAHFRRSRRCRPRAVAVKTGPKFPLRNQFALLAPYPCRALILDFACHSGNFGSSGVAGSHPSSAFAGDRPTPDRQARFQQDGSDDGFSRALPATDVAVVENCIGNSKGWDGAAGTLDIARLCRNR